MTENDESPEMEKISQQENGRDVLDLMEAREIIVDDDIEADEVEDEDGEDSSMAVVMKPRCRHETCTKRTGRYRQESHQTGSIAIWKTKRRAIRWAFLIFLQLFHLPSAVAVHRRRLPTEQVFVDFEARSFEPPAAPPPSSSSSKSSTTPWRVHRGLPTEQVFVDFEDRPYGPPAAPPPPPPSPPNSSTAPRPDKRPIDERLRLERGIVAYKVGSAVHYAAPSCKPVEVDFSMYANGRVLDEMLSPYTRYLEEAAQKPGILENANIMLAHAAEIVDKTKASMKAETDSLLQKYGLLEKALQEKQYSEDDDDPVIAHGAWFAFVGIAAIAYIIYNPSGAMSFISSIFGSSEETMKRNMEKFGRALQEDYKANQFRSEYAAHVREVRQALMQALRDVLEMLYVHRRFPYQLAITDEAAKDLLEKMVGRYFFQQSVYVESPLQGLDILEILNVQRGDANYKIIIQACAPMVARHEAKPLYLVEPLGGWSPTGVYAQPRLNFHYVIVDDYEMNDVSAVDISNCRQVNDIHYCSRVWVPPKDCNLQDQSGCKYNPRGKKDWQSEFVFARTIGEYHVVATTATSGTQEDLNTGEKTEFTVPSRNFIMKAPANTYLWLAGEPIIGNGAIQARMAIEETSYEAKVLIENLSDGALDYKVNYVWESMPHVWTWLQKIGGLCLFMFLAYVLFGIWQNRQNGKVNFNQFLNCLTASKAVEKAQKYAKRQKKRDQDASYRPGMSSAEPSDAETDVKKVSKLYRDARSLLGWAGKKMVKDPKTQEEYELNLISPDPQNYKLLKRELQRVADEQAAKKLTARDVETAAADDADDEQGILRHRRRRRRDSVVSIEPQRNLYYNDTVQGSDNVEMPLTSGDGDTIRRSVTPSRPLLPPMDHIVRGIPGLQGAAAHNGGQLGDDSSGSATPLTKTPSSHSVFNTYH